MGNRLYASDKSFEKSQVLHASEIIKSQIRFTYQQKHPHQYYLNTTIPISNQQFQVNEYIEALQKACQYIETQNLYLPVAWQKNTGQMCETFKDLQLYYPVFNYQLRNEIQARKITRQGFTQPQIWYLLWSILNGIKQFQKIGLLSTKLEIDSIRMNSQGFIKIQNGLTNLKNFQQTLQMQKHRISFIDYQIQQTYNLGLILLDVCTFSSNSQYSRFSNSLHSSHFPHLISIISSQYSELLTTLITVMLSSLSDRPLPSQICQIFAPFRHDIINFQPFNFNVNSMRDSISHSKATLPNMYNTTNGYESKNNHPLQFQQEQVHSKYNPNHPNIQNFHNSQQFESLNGVNYERNGVHYNNNMQYLSPIMYQNPRRNW